MFTINGVGTLRPIQTSSNIPRAELLAADIDTLMEGVSPEQLAYLLKRARAEQAGVSLTILAVELLPALHLPPSDSHQAIFWQKGVISRRLVGGRIASGPIPLEDTGLLAYVSKALAASSRDFPGLTVGLSTAKLPGIAAFNTASIWLELMATVQLFGNDQEAADIVANAINTYLAAHQPP